MPNLIRNRVTERDIRDWFNENGYHGGSAVLESVELYAIQRPGWRQLFRFSGRVRLQSANPDETPKRMPVWGVVLDDERKPLGQRTQVTLCDCENDQLEQLSKLSDGMITASKSDDRPFGIWSLFCIALFFAAMLFLIAMVKSFYE